MLLVGKVNSSRNTRVLYLQLCIILGRSDDMP